MAPRAGFGNIQTINRRLGIAIIQKRVRLSVTIYATRGRDPNPHGDAMVGRSVDLGFDSMTIGALDRRRFVLMRDLTDIIMTGSAEVLAVDGTGILRRIDLVVAGKTILVLDLLGIDAVSFRAKSRQQHEAEEKKHDYFDGRF